MFDYAVEKQKLDQQLEGELISREQYDKNIFYLDQAAQKINANRAAFYNRQIDGLTYNQREAEIVKEYDMNIHLHKVKAAKAKKVRRNILGFVGLAACAVIAVIVVNIVTEGYKHRSVSGIPEPTQGDAAGSLTLTQDYNTIELTYMHSYEIDGLIIFKKIDTGTDAYSSSIPFIFGMAWGYTAEHNGEITWAYNNRNLKAKEYAGLDRLSIEKSYSINEIIPADDTVKRDLERYGQGDRIKITGILVTAHVYNATEDYTIKSSELRGDMNNAVAGSPSANEVIYATKVTKVFD